VELAQADAEYKKEEVLTSACGGAANLDPENCCRSRHESKAQNEGGVGSGGPRTRSEKGRREDTRLREISAENLLKFKIDFPKLTYRISFIPSEISGKNIHR